MKTLFIKTKEPIDFYINGSTKITDIVEGELTNVSTAGYGNSMGANFAYYGIVDEARVRIEAGAFNLDESEMNAMYDAVKVGIPAGATYTEINLYLFSTVFISKMQEKYVLINPTLKTSDIEVVEPAE